MDEIDIPRSSPIHSKTEDEDDTTSSLAEDIIINKYPRVFHLNYENIRFTPRVIEFIDAFEGKQLSVKWKIQNIGKNPVMIKIGEPNSFIFQLKYPFPHATFLASGSCIVKKICYTYHSDDLVQKSQIPVQIDGTWLDYPIVVKKAAPEVEVEPQKLHFKRINLGATATSLTLKILNKGGKRTKFEIDVGKNDLNLVVNPLKATVKAKSFLNVSVEMMGCTEGEFYQELWIKSSAPPIRVPVLVEVVRPHLQVVHPKGTENFTLISFRPAYRGTQSANSFVLRNFSTEPTLFVILAEINGELHDLNKGEKLTDAYNMFKVTAEEGLLAPFESRIVKVLFCPKVLVKTKGWVHSDLKKKNQIDGQYIVFLRINRVHCIEQKELAKLQVKTLRSKLMEKEDGEKPMVTLKEQAEIRRTFVYETQTEANFLETIDDFLMDTPDEGEEIVRLCLHGQAVEPDFLLQPTSFDYDDIYLGQTVNKVLKVTNKGIISIKCVFCKLRNVRVTPNDFWLKSEKSQDFLISLTPTFAGIFKISMKVKILAESDDMSKKDKDLMAISVCNVLLNYTARDLPVTPKPKVGLGITPLVKDEVGFQKDLVTFKDVDKLPKAAVLGLKYGTKPAWMAKEKNPTENVDNAIVALPNDMSRGFDSWPKDKAWRSIFRGFFRYFPPEDLAYTLSPEGRILKKMRQEIWAEFLLKNIKHPQVLKYSLEGESYDSCGSGDYKQVSKEFAPNLDWCKKYMGYRDAYPGNSLVPLTPLFLYHIHVEPRLINFSTVAISIRAQETVTIKNTNPFPISIRFVSGKTAVYVLEEGTFTIQPNKKKSVQVFFQTHDLGRYFGFLNYIINGSHEFKITISAFVTPKSLILRDKDLNLEFGKYEMKDPFQARSVFLPVQNILQAPVTYRWVFSPDSAYFTEIINGEIPPRSKLLIEIFFNLNPLTSFYSETTFISESGCPKLIKLSYPFKKVAVDFLTTRVDMHDIPLNLPTKVKPVIQNSCYHDVSFEVLTTDPMPGVTIEPKYGVIKPRSFFPLDIIVQVPVIMKFSFDVVILIHFVTKISVKVIGNVVLPVIRLKPAEVNLQKICAQSFDCFTICASNVGTTPAEMEINLKSCPELTTADGLSEWYLPPKKTVKITINFEPLEATRYVFYLPIIINRILGPPMVQESETEYVSFYLVKYESTYKNFGKVNDSQIYRVRLPCIFLSCHISQKILELSTLNMEFRKRPYDTVFQPQTLEISNNFVDEVEFCIRNDDLGEINDSPFTLTPVNNEFVEYRLKSLKVILKRGEKIEFKGTFNPTKPGYFKVAVPIFIRGYNEGFAFNYIHMKGHLNPPRIRPMFTEVHFPPVPLGVGYDIILGVTAEHYTSYDVLRCLVLNKKDKSSNYITTSWLAEPQVNRCGLKQEFKLHINFMSPVPVAVSAYVLVLDSSGGYATILVTALAENSSLTTHAFLETKTYSYKLIREVPITSWEKTDITPHPVKKPGLKQIDGIEKGEKGEKAEKAEKAEKGESSEKDRKQWQSDHSGGLLMEQKVNTGGPDINGIFVLDRGPRLILNARKSIIKPAVLGIPEIAIGFSGTALNVVKVEPLNSASSRTDNSMSSSFMPSSHMRKTKPKSFNEHLFPNFPSEGTIHRPYFQRTLSYVERWIFQAAMRCQQYFSIPQSFQSVKLRKTVSRPYSAKEETETSVKKDFIDFLEEIVGRDQNLPLRPSHQESNLTESAISLCLFFKDVLKYLHGKGCVFPHVKPEYLLDYEHYAAYCKTTSFNESFVWGSSEEAFSNFTKPNPQVKNKWDLDTLQKDNSHSSDDILNPKKSFGFLDDNDDTATVMEHRIEGVPSSAIMSIKNAQHQNEPLQDLLTGKRFDHKKEVLDRMTFDCRSTQAWFDIAIQIFKVFALNRVVQRSTIPNILVLDLQDKIFESTDLFCIPHYGKKLKNIASLSNVNIHSTNIYSTEEIILLNWLNYHLILQNNALWKSKSHSCRALNGFDKDLSDSIALISVTASHCPYIVHEYFDDVFARPDTLNKLHHNAGKLVLAWRALNIGLTVETTDIVNPNPVFMVMLVTHLYEILPWLHPHSQICFSAPLNSELMRTIQVKNDSQERLIYRAKFFGEHQGFFRVDYNSDIEMAPLNTKGIEIVFKARKIKKTSATLLLTGCSVSPNFGRPLTFYLEGEPSGLPVHEKYFLNPPLYKVICSDIPVKAPYPDSATYEICYTTKRPQYNGNSDIGLQVKPWSKIWKRKVSRRLFLNQDEVVIQEKRKEVLLSVTIACLTIKKRMFWLLFRSEISDFIIQIEIIPRILEPQVVLNGFYSVACNPKSVCVCNCNQTTKTLKSNLAPCPLVTKINVPTRNDDLWKALKTMFIKTLIPEEKAFWVEHFETDIGICLILWLLSPEEEEEVMDEFVHALSSRVTYTVQLDGAGSKSFVTIPKIEISDVRQASKISLPIHMTRELEDDRYIRLTMTSENGTEVRNLQVYLRPFTEVKDSKDESVSPSADLQSDVKYEY